MIGIGELLFQLREAGISLWAEDGKLRFRAPTGALTDSFRNQLKERKSELLAFLASSSAAVEESLFPPLKRMPRDQPLPVAHNQKSLWFLDQMASSGVYNIPSLVTLTGALVVAHLETALRDIIDRHEILRTSFPAQGGDPVQWIKLSIPFKLHLVDLTRIDEYAQALYMRNVFNYEALHRFDLENGPLLRVCLYRVAPQNHVLSLNMHHIISDAESVEILVAEIAAQYALALKATSQPLPELGIQYADWAAWQHQILLAEAMDKQLAFWRLRLAGAPPLLTLPGDRPRPAAQSYRGGIEHGEIPAALAARLQGLAQQNGVTMSMLCNAAFAVLLCRYSGQTDLVVGNPISRRSRPELEPLIGYFVNTIAMRHELDANAPFRDFLATVRANYIEAYNHQDIPFERVVNALAPSRALSQTPLFQVMFSYQKELAGSLVFHGLEMSALETEYLMAKFDLDVTLRETGSGLVCSCGFARDLFDAESIQALIRRFHVILDAVSQQPDRQIQHIDILLPGERQVLLYQWQGKQINHPELTLVQWFEANAERFANSVALVLPAAATPRERDILVTYGELNTLANRLAHHLKERGVGKETLVGVLLRRELEIPVSMLAVLKAGGAYVPLDPTYPAERLEHMIQDCQPSLVITMRNLAPSAGHGALVLLDELDLNHVPAHNPGQHAKHSDLAYLIYTSGSTGKPKGTLVEQASLANFLHGVHRRFPLNADTVMPCFLSFSFDIFIFQFTTPLLVGGKCYFLRRSQVVDMGVFCTLMEHFTLLHSTPTLMSQILGTLQHLGKKMPNVQLTFVGGDMVQPTLFESMRRSFPNAKLVEDYGPTEATIVCSHYPVPEHIQECMHVIGTPLDNVQMRVYDAHGNLAPVGIYGELFIGGAACSRGYFERDDLTADKFVTLDNQRFYRSGDKVRFRRDGMLEISGRVDNMVKIRGYRIELGEVEAVLCLHPDVSEVAVISRQDGDRDRFLAAYVEPREDLEQPLRPADLRAFLAEKVPHYMVPAAIEIMTALPVTINGKVDRKALAQLPPPNTEADENFVSPRNKVEEVLAKIWADLLGRDKVGLRDNFFALGGDSILSIQVVARASKAGLVFTPKQFFEHQTIEELAPLLKFTERALVDQGPVIGPYALTPVQKAFFEWPDQRPQHFNQALFLKTAPGLNMSHLQMALEHLLRHHDALRSRFNVGPEGWKAVLAESGSPFNLTESDLSRLDPTHQRLEMQRSANQLQRTIHLAQGPLLVAAWFHLGESGRLLLVCHHLVVDGVSWRILIEDLEVAYRQLSRQQAIEIPPKSTSLVTWGQKQTEFIRKQAAQQLALWRELAYVATPNEITLDGDNLLGVNSFSAARTLESVLDSDRTHALLTEVPAAYRTKINDILVAALVLAMRQTFQSDHLLLTLEGHGREALTDDLDLSRTVGWFTAQYPICLSYHGQPLHTLIQTTKERLRAVPHGGTTYGMLRHMADPQIALELQSWPAPKLSFNYLGQFDQVFEAEGLFSPAEETLDETINPLRTREHLLDFTAHISGGKLQVGLTYCGHFHQAESMRALLDGCMIALNRLIDFCLDPSNFGYTVSDFPLAELDQDELNQFLDKPHVVDLYPLSPMQAGILFHALLEPDSRLYFSQMDCLLTGQLQVSAFQKAWLAVMNRHTSLRATIHWDKLRTPLQRIDSDPFLDWRFFDATESDETRFQTDLAQFIQADRAQGFSLNAGPLMRFALFQRSPQQHHFVWTHHHILVDGWSLPIIFREVLTYYQALLEQRDHGLPPARPFRDYIGWLKQQDLGAAKRFWTQALSGFEGDTSPRDLRLEHPLDEYLPTGGDADFGQYACYLSAELTRSLEKLARELRITLNVVTQGAWAMLLSHYAAADDVVFGATVSGRPAQLPGVESMVGLFINVLPVRVPIRRDLHLAHWLETLQNRQVERESFSYSPLVDIQGWAHMPAGSHLFETALVFENFPVDQSMNQASNLLDVSQIRGFDRNNLPLTLTAAGGERMSLRLNFEARRFDRMGAQAILNQLEHLLQQFAQDHHGLLATFSLTTDQERTHLLRHHLAEVDPRPRSLLSTFEAQVARDPQATALIYEDRAISYGELNATANATAWPLIKAGCGPNMSVALLLEHGPAQLIAILAVIKAGAAFVSLDPENPTFRLGQLLADIKPTCLLGDPSSLSRHEATLRNSCEMDALKVFSHSAVTASSLPVQIFPPHANNANPPTKTEPDHLGYVVFTSGSTGTPKGIAQPSRTLAHFVHWYAKRFAVAGRNIGLWSSLNYDTAYYESFSALCYGAALHQVSPLEKLHPEATLTWLRNHNIHQVKMVPNYCAQLALQAERLRQESGANPVPLLENLLLAGEVLPVGLVRTWKRLSDGKLNLINLYGPSETILATCCDVADPTPKQRIIPLGSPIEGRQILLLAPSGQPCPVGVPGEIYIRTHFLAEGYLNRKDETKARFVTCPIDLGEPRLAYRTGDIARFLPGELLEFLGRTDQQIKVRGMRVELGEIERVLNLHELVRECAVVALTKDGETHLAAYVCLIRPIEIEALLAFMEERLLPHMLPASFTFLDALPKTSTGKISRKDLPAPNKLRNASTYQEPRDQLDKDVAEIWREVLGVPRVGIHDNFFQAGGHSLLAIQVLVRLNAKFSVELPLRTIFALPTVAQLAEKLRRHATTEREEIPRLPHRQQIPASFAQQRLWFLDRLEGGATYHMPFVLNVTGHLERQTLEASLLRIVRRHETLRTRFPERDGNPIQVVAEDIALAIDAYDCFGYRDEQLEDLIQQETSRPFDLEKGPLFRVTLLKRADQEHVLLINVHHIIFDGWSVGVMVKELVAFYGNDAAELLPPLDVQYAEFACWQRDRLNKGLMQQQLDYWRKTLSEPPTLLTLPTRAPRPAVQRFHGARYGFQIDAKLTQQLEFLYLELGTTPFMLLQAAFTVLMARYSGQEDILVGTPTANRTRKELEPMIGFFANTLVLRSDLAGDPNFLDHLERTSRTALEAYDNQDVPFETIVESLQPERTLAHAPLFQVMFVLQTAPIDKLRLPQLELTMRDYERTTARFDLLVSLMSSEEGMGGSVEYKTDLFDATAIETLVRHYLFLLGEIAANPDRAISQLRLAADNQNVDAAGLAQASNLHHSWYRQQPIDLALIDRTLLNAPKVLDGTTLIHRSVEDQELLVAYVVHQGVFNEQAIRQHMSHALPEHWVPNHIVPISHLPLNQRGRLDEAALRRIPIVPPSLLDTWQAALLQVDGIDDAALLMQEVAVSEPPLHLDRLIAHRRGAAVANTVEKTSERGQVALSGNGPLAFSDGGPLHLPQDAPTTMSAALLKTAQRFPDKGIYFVSPGQTLFLTYPQLLERGLRILTGLRQAGLQPGHKVILQTEHLPDHLAAFWACLLGGIIPVTVAIAPSYQQPNAVVNKLFNAWTLLDKPTILTSSSLHSALQGLEQVLPFQGIHVLVIDELLTHAAATSWYQASQKDTAFFQLTSGSTGIPKCINETHGALVAHVFGSAAACDYGANDITLNWLPMDHVVPILTFHLKDTYLGCNQVELNTQMVLDHPLLWLEKLEEYRVTHTWAPNFGFKLVTDALERNPERTFDLSAMKYFMNAGEQVTLPVVSAFLERLQPFGISSQAMQPAFGMAEVCTCMTYNNDFDAVRSIHRFDKTALAGKLKRVEDAETPSTSFVDLGGPMPGIQIRIADDQNQTVEEEIIGRFQIRGATLMPGYFNNPEANLEAYVGDGWFNSGDLGFISSGRLTLTGREKEMIIIRGANFYCYEIEDIVNSIPGVLPTFTGAVDIDDPATGTESLAVFFVPRQDQDWPALNLVAEIKTRITAELSIAPAYVIPLLRHEFPKTTSGKIQRGQLKKNLLAGAYETLIQRLDLLLENANTVPQFFYKLTWQPSRLPLRSATGKDEPNTWLVFADNKGLALAVMTRLRASGHQLIEVLMAENFQQDSETRYALNPLNPSHYSRLLASLERDNRFPTHILSASTYDDYHAKSLTGARLIQACKVNLDKLLYLVQALQDANPNERPISLRYVSDHSWSITAEDRLALEKTSVHGFLKTAGLELPWLHACHLDLEGSSREQDIAHLVRECALESRDAQIAYRGAMRLVPRLEQLALEAEPSRELPLVQGGCYLISGGLGGAAPILANWLLKHYKARLLLVGRTRMKQLQNAKVPAHAQKLRLLERLRKQGEVAYRSVDILDEDALQSAVKEVVEQDWGTQLDGVFHLAGVLQEQMLLNETPQSLLASISAKTGGSLALFKLIEHRPDALFVAFSSVNGFFGGSTVAGYSAGNSFLDSFVHHIARTSRVKAYALAFSLMDEVGMSQGYAAKELARAKGYRVISPDQVLAALQVALTREPGHILIGLDGNNPHLRHMLHGEPRTLLEPVAYYAGKASLPEATLRAAISPIPRLTCHFAHLDHLARTPEGALDLANLSSVYLAGRSGAVRIAPRTEVEKTVGDIWQDLLGVTQVSVHDNFFNLGGHSLLAGRVLAQIREALAVPLQLPDLFEAQTLEQLALRIENLQGGPQAQNLPAVVEVNRNRALALSHNQLRMWLLDRIVAYRPSYYLTLALRLQGHLDVALLMATLNRIIARHEVLRTLFPEVNGRPIQMIQPHVERIFPVIDLSTMASARLDQETRNLVDREANRLFDLGVGPLLRFTLVRQKAQDHVALLTLHHIISDAWSVGILVDEIVHLYGRGIANRESNLTDLPVQYAEFSYWQRSLEEHEIFKRQAEYWKKQLQDIPSNLNLPIDRAPGLVRGTGGGRHSFHLDSNTASALKHLARTSGTTLFMVLETLWSALLQRYSGQTEIMVGTPVANRNKPEFEALIGFFVNTLVLRNVFNDAPSLHQQLERTRAMTLAAFSNQDLPFDQMVELLNPERKTDQSPLFQVMFDLQNAPINALDLPGLRISPVYREHSGAMFDLTLSIAEDGDRLYASLEYNKDLFDQATANLMIGHFVTFTEAALAAPNHALEKLPLLSEAELRRHIQSWNQTSGSHPENWCHELVEHWAARTPNGQALLYVKDPDLSMPQGALTYAELNQRANQLAWHLRKSGVGMGSVIALHLNRSLEAIVAMVAVMKTGAAYLNLDAKFPKEMITYMLESTCAKFLILDQNEDITCPAETQRLFLSQSEDLLARQPQDNLDLHIPAAALAYLIFTSGSTGQPKGVMIDHLSLSNHVRFVGDLLKLDPTAISPLLSSLTFDSMVDELYGPLSKGGAVILRGPDVWSPAQLTRVLIDLKANVMPGITTAYWNELITYWRDLDPKQLAQIKTRACSVGGEALSGDLATCWYQLFPSHKLYNTYGPTEITSTATYFLAEPENPRAIVPIGKPLDNRKVYIVDKHLSLVPVNVPGELVIGGLGLARGYLNRPAATAERFIPNAFDTTPGGRLYRSGDLTTYTHEGVICYQGRLDQQVKIRGYRIEPKEIEAALRRHPDVCECIVDPQDTGSGTRLVAYMVPRQPGEAQIDPSEIREFMRKCIPSYMVPNAYVWLRALPLNTSGKLDRKALPKPQLCHMAGKAQIVPPRNEMERTLSTIWMELLAHDEISIHSDFFDLGGHSLSLTRLVSQVLETFKVKITLREAFEHPTIAGLAELIKAQQAKETEERMRRLVGQVKNMSKEETLRQIQLLKAIKEGKK